MLTRVEIDGFKSFESFSIDLPSFCVIVGPNASGKSNFFDALRLISRLADVDFSEAAKEVRGRPHELFRLGRNQRTHGVMTFGLEVLLDRRVLDAFGTWHELKNTRVRYDLSLELRRDENASLERVYVVHESANLIKRSEDRLFRDRKLTGAKLSSLKSWAVAKAGVLELIKRTQVDGSPAIEIRQDGSGGRRRTVPLGRSSRTYLSSVGGADEALHLFALRQELRALTFLHLEPSAAGQPSDMVSGDDLDPRGANLAKVLARMEAETSTPEQQEGVLADIRQSLTALIPEVVGLRVQRDEAARKFHVFAKLNDGTEFGSQLLSDGTLRLLALITCLHDDRRRGTLCFEEPENGIHEARIPGLIDLLRRWSTDLSHPPLTDDAVSQIIVNSHSPVVLESLKAHEVIAADMIDRLNPEVKTSSRLTRMRVGVVDELDISRSDDPGARLTRFETLRLLQRSRPEPVA